eukprot:CAMPEP_0113690520 /NCGR_PEP_ID=MMETSP0038_2-20120614/17840_1 /TAXON_ID=2898 /ORGANISM="Cryptomonas paramecium" /LENGTH=94 /DNA_ID=CAMNT_0000611861 /DNA_START=198 /DNA_END=478 /DNA_ORIENTATION=- /assembly_acc=CAM_ASM_000170
MTLTKAHCAKCPPCPTQCERSRKVHNIASSKTVSSRVRRVPDEIGHAGGLVPDELKPRTISQWESGDRLRFEDPSSKSMDDSTNIAWVRTRYLG